MGQLEFLITIQKPRVPYLILRNQYIATLQMAVNHLLNLGYSLCGGLIFDGTEYVQTMFSYDRVLSATHKEHEFIGGGEDEFEKAYCATCNLSLHGGNHKAEAPEKA